MLFRTWAWFLSGIWICVLAFHATPDCQAASFEIRTVDELVGRCNGTGGWQQAGAGDVLEIAPGTFDLNEARLDPLPGVELSGSGADQTHLVNGEIQSFGDPDASGRLHIHDLHVSGAVHLRNTGNVLIEDCEFTDSADNGLTVWANATAMQVNARRVTLRNSASDGFSTKARGGFGAGSLLRLEDCRSLGVGPERHNQNVTAHSGFPIQIQGGVFRDSGGSNIRGDNEEGSWIDVSGAVCLEAGEGMYNVVGRNVHDTVCLGGESNGGILLEAAASEFGSCEASTNVVVSGRISCILPTEEVAVRSNYVGGVPGAISVNIAVAKKVELVRNALAAPRGLAANLGHTPGARVAENLFMDCADGFYLNAPDGELELSRNVFLDGCGEAIISSGLPAWSGGSNLVLARSSTGIG